MNEQYIDTIHRYLSDEMDGAELETFNIQLQNDPKLKNDVEIERLLLGGLERSAEAGLRQTIGAVHQKLTAEGFFKAEAAESASTLSVSHLSKTTPMRRILAIAATFVLLAGAVWFFNRQEAPVDSNALFSQFYKPEQDQQKAQKIIASLETVGMAGAESGEDTLRQALQLYEAGNYDASQKLLKTYLETYPDNETALYYLGVIHMSQGRYAKAIELLTPLSRSTTSDFKNDALWNLGLCYLKTENNQQDAVEVFTKLSNDNDFSNHRGAKAVLDQLLPKK